MAPLVHSRQVALCTHSRQTRVLVQLEVKLQNADPPTIEVTAIFVLGCVVWKPTELQKFAIIYKYERILKTITSSLFEAQVSMPCSCHYV